MKSKKAMGQKTIVSILLMTFVVIILLFVFYGPEQTFSKLKNAVMFLPKMVGLRIGQPEIAPIEFEAPHDLEVSLDQLEGVFTKYAKSTDTRCLIKYPELTDNFGDCWINLRYSANYKFYMEIACEHELGGNPRIVKTTAKPGEPGLNMVPCIVGGKLIDETGKESFPSLNFRKNWITAESELPTESLELPEHHSSYLITITDRLHFKTEQGPFFLGDDNKETGFLYKEDQYRICFFPTVWFDAHIGSWGYEPEKGLKISEVNALNPKYNIPFCKE